MGIGLKASPVRADLDYGTLMDHLPFGLCAHPELLKVLNASIAVHETT